MFPSKTWNLKKKSLFPASEWCRATMSPRKITSRASRFAEWPPSQSKSTRLCLTLHHIASTTLTPSLAFFSPITNIWLLHPQKAFFSKNLKKIKKFFSEDHIVTMYYDLL